MCTKNKSNAAYDSKNAQGVEQTSITIFKIHLNGLNRAATNIDIVNAKDKLKAEFTLNPGHEEVLLLPLFTFQVTDITTETKDVKLASDDGGEKVNMK
jgi:hypothetical protein